MLIGFGLGFALYGPIALYGIMAIEASPAHISGTSQAIVALAANGKIIFMNVQSTMVNYINPFADG